VELVLIAVAAVSGLLLLYTVVRLGVRDGVLDARARDDAELAQRRLDDPGRDSRASISLLEDVDDRSEKSS
jgi:hypothetical protein